MTPRPPHTADYADVEAAAYIDLEKEGEFGRFLYFHAEIRRSQNTPAASGRVCWRRCLLRRGHAARRRHGMFTLNVIHYPSSSVVQPTEVGCR